MNDKVYRQQAHRLLQAHPYVDADPAHLIEILQACELRRVRQGRILCREGDPGVLLYILLKGTITVLKRDLGGQDRPVGEVHAPTLLGQMGIIDRARRTATCVAAEDTVVAVMDQTTFQTLVRDTSARGITLRRLLLSSLTRQLVQGNDRLRELMKARAELPTAEQPRMDDELLRAAGVLEGWTDDVGERAQGRRRGRSSS